jgi:hypothetical protein
MDNYFESMLFEPTGRRAQKASIQNKTLLPPKAAG